jgi:hypothetical protein
MLFTTAAAFLVNATQTAPKLRSGAWGKMMRQKALEATGRAEAVEATMAAKTKARSMFGFRRRSGGAAEGEEGMAAAAAEQVQEEVAAAQTAQGRGLLGGLGGIVASPASLSTEKSGGTSGVAIVLLLIVAVVYVIGLCTFWSRANPTKPTVVRILAYIFLALFGDFYMIYVVFRFAYFGITGRADPGYAALHKPTAFFSPARSSSGKASAMV